ncbi:MAG TPA: long-chain fatty acid--CoA ligase [Aggregatilinea sp.]|uniref:long-chain-fatty-acid--CoA ligase n=1 Tax=Aggregatilinea sp. TaxID=2806333 RepID=UPI002C101652|nr:long-chain fatty acid--CoA ligase [Aggregatilinea sp.]HML20122.1 long-chain fatty acid--CoA ligase [Aggregatilinea sp.]
MVTYADKPWLEHYDPGVPKSLDPYPNYALQEFLIQSAVQFGDAPATLTSAHLPLIGRVDTTINYRDLNAMTDALAAALVDMGLQKGDRVALIMPNCVQFVTAFYATLKAGGVVVALNPTYPPKRLAEQLNDCGAEFAVVLSLFYNNLKQIQGETGVKHIIVTNVKEYLPGLARPLFTLAREKKDGHRIEKDPQDHWLKDVLARYAGKKPGVEVTGEDIAVFQYTGGTTGIPKAAMSTHSALVANTLQCQAWLSRNRDECFLAAIPLFHVFGMVAVMSFAVSLHSLMVLVPNARDIADVVQNIDHYKPTIFMGVPAIFNAINNHPGVKSGEYDLSSIYACISGSAPLPPATKRRFEELSGGVILEGFGMSEAPTASHVNPVRGENRAGSIGLPVPDMEMRIVDVDDGVTEVPVGEVGELVMYGPQLMVGYYGMPTETANALRKRDDQKLWLFTGDIARMDEDGYFYIVDRKKDMALIGGFNVYPRVVEDVLMEHPAVQEVGVAAIPHPDPNKVGQEALKAWVVRREDTQLTTEDLIAFAGERLARYEIPTRIEFVDELPRTSVGKILRRELARMDLEAREQAEKS